MSWVSFDPFRTRGFPHTITLKADHFYRELDAIRAASRVLFPDHHLLGALVYALGARVFPSEAAYRIGHDKVEMTRAFTALCPANVPTTLILANTAAGAADAWQEMSLPFVAKVPRSAEGRGVFLIETHADFRRYLTVSPVIYVQEFLPIDRDIRVVVVGGEVIASYWRLQSADGFHNNVARGGVVDYTPVPSHVSEFVLDVAQRLGIDYGGFDVALIGDHPFLLEFNRLFGTSGIPGGGAFLREKTLGYLLRDDGQDPGLGPRGWKRVA